MFYPHIKSEASDSPDLSPVHHFHFKFPPSHDPQRPPSDPPTPLYRFGQYHQSHDHNNYQQHWSTSASPPPHQLQYMSYSDDYDDTSVTNYLSTSLAASNAERTVRRRSSKACDQCRKSKCKCERSGLNEPCKNCIMLGTPCTFLGPSRKRGPPKGYIDAIEARLHQTEALVGIMLASKDPRAQSLLRDMAKDSLAREIIVRVDKSPYGVKGRKWDHDTPDSKARASSSEVKQREDGRLDLTSTHPSNDWQDKVVDMLGAGRTNEPSYLQSAPSSSFNDENGQPMEGRQRQRRRLGEEDYNLEYTNSTVDATSSKTDGQDREEEEKELTEAVGELSLNEDEEVRYHGQASGLYLLTDKERVDSRNEGGIWRFPGARVWPPLPPSSENSDDLSSEEASLTPPHTQLRTIPVSSGESTSHHPINPEYSIKSPVNPSRPTRPSGEEFLPPKHEQERLLDLYFTYVHPSFPVMHKKAFWEAWRAGNSGDIYPTTRRDRRIAPLLLLAMFALAARYDVPSPSPISPAKSPTLPTRREPPPTSPSSGNPLPTDGIFMWTAGEQYLNSAKALLDTSYASSRPSTCQALLLLGYREIGIGAMALAWTYIGMAIRMAQDLGMHRKAEGWRRPGLGKVHEGAIAEAAAQDDHLKEKGRLFDDWELGERRRIWFGCVVMDKYVSAYIGRPLMIFEKDFDTEPPELTESEEMEEWKSLDVKGEWTAPVPGRVISCFNECARLSGILSAVIQAIYAVRPFPGAPGTLSNSTPTHTRRAEIAKEATVLEGLLDKWYFKLPTHLRFDPAVERDSSSLPPPHVLTLHMQYWCAVLLLHRPFIRYALNARSRTRQENLGPDDDEEFMQSKRSYELCLSAATHITSIATAYREKYSLQRCSVFLCYYLFTASIMHVINLTAYPDDPQARINLGRCLNSLSSMRYVWPSASRALELLSGAKMSFGICPNMEVMADTTPSKLAPPATRYKRKSNLDENVGVSATSPTLANPGAVVPSDPSTHLYRLNLGVTTTQLTRQDQLQDRPYQQVRYQPHSFGSPTEPYAVQPPSLLPTSYRWAEPASLSPNISTSALEQQSDMRSTGRQHQEEPEFSGPLSTSVLPQLYSTGFSDEPTHQSQQHQLQGSHQPLAHVPHPQQHHQYAQSHVTPHSQDHSHPQYWSDYSTYSQLGTTDTTAYTGLGMVAGVNTMDLGLPNTRPTQHPQQAVVPESQHSGVSGLYLPDSYLMYGAGYR